MEILLCAVFESDSKCHSDNCRYINLKCFACCLQRFQKCEYAKTKLFRTEGRGWGLLADENIKVILLKQPPYFIFRWPLICISQFWHIQIDFSFFDSHVKKKFQN